MKHTHWRNGEILHGIHRQMSEIALFLIVAFCLIHFVNLQRLKSDVQKEYEKFLSGQKDAISEDMNVWTIKELFEQEDSVSYL